MTAIPRLPLPENELLVNGNTKTYVRIKSPNNKIFKLFSFLSLNGVIFTSVTMNPQIRNI